MLVYASVIWFARQPTFPDWRVGLFLHSIVCPNRHCCQPTQPWAQGHNLVVSAVGFENRRLGLSVVDIDAAMRKLCTDPNSLARGDILVRTNDLEIKDCAAGYAYARKQFVIDVKTVCQSTVGS